MLNPALDQPFSESSSYLTETESTRASTLCEGSVLSYEIFDFENFAEVHRIEALPPDEYSIHSSNPSNRSSLLASNRSSLLSYNRSSLLSSTRSFNQAEDAPIAASEEEKANELINLVEAHPLTQDVLNLAIAEETPAFNHASAMFLRHDSAPKFSHSPILPSPNLAKIPALLNPNTVRFRIGGVKSFDELFGTKKIVKKKCPPTTNPDPHQADPESKADPLYQDVLSPRMDIATSNHTSGMLHLQDYHPTLPYSRNLSSPNVTSINPFSNVNRVPFRIGGKSYDEYLGPKKIVKNVRPSTKKPAVETRDESKSDRLIAKFDTWEQYDILKKSPAIREKLCQKILYRITKAGLEALIELDTRVRTASLETLVYGNEEVQNILHLTTENEWNKLLGLNWSVEYDYGEGVNINFESIKAAKQTKRDNGKLNFY